MSAPVRRPGAVVVHGPPAWLAAVPVRRWMKQPVATIGPRTALRDAVALMRERGIRHLPVLDGAQRLIGIVTDRDLRQVMFDVALGGVDEHAARHGDLPVREVMTWGVVTVTPATDLREAIAVMRERRLGALPVVDAAAHVVGMLTERDLLDALHTLLRERVVHPRPFAATLGGPDEAGLEATFDGDAWQDTAAQD